MRPLDQALAHDQERERQHEASHHRSRAATAAQAIAGERDDQHQGGLGQHQGGESAQPEEQRGHEVKQPGRIEVGRVGEREREEIAMNDVPGAQEFLAGRHAEK